MLQRGSALVANRSIQKRLQGRDACSIAIDAMRVAGDRCGQFSSFCGCAAEKARNGNVLVDRPRHRLADIHHIQDSGRVPATHHLASQSNDRKIVNQALQDRVTT